MTWADHAIKKLLDGEQAVIRPVGNSMQGKVESGATVTLEPVTEVAQGDIVLVEVNGRVYLHLVKAVQGNRYQIGNNKGRINGWVSIQSIYGKAVKIE